MISVINGDLLSSDAEYIVQQCGTNVNKAMGLSLAIIKNDLIVIFIKNHVYQGQLL
jgi:hypothetical protein